MDAVQIYHFHEPTKHQEQVSKLGPSKTKARFKIGFGLAMSL